MILSPVIVVALGRALAYAECGQARMGSDPQSDATETPSALFSASFEGAYDDELPWAAVHALRRRGSHEVFDLAAAYSRSEMAIHRARALDVLGQLDAGKPFPERPYFNESVSIALSRLGDADAQVARSSAWALAHLRGDLAISALIEAKRSVDAEIRWAVAFGLLGSERPDAIQTLMELMEDDDGEVRNWATFALGNAGAEKGPPARSGVLDSDAIRDALRKRLTDSFREVRDEAVWGLAQRRDPSALQLLLDRLSSNEWVAGDEMAAAEVLGLPLDAPVEELRAGLRTLLDHC